MASRIFSDRLTPAEVAEALGVKPSTLEKWRSVGRYNLPYFKIGRYVFYKRADIEAFIESRRRVHTSATR